MKRSLQRTALLLLAGLLIHGTATAQHGAGHGKHHQYDPATVQTYSGVVVGIDSVAMMDHVGIHLQFKTDAETIEVHLGPDWFLSKQDELIQQGDEIAVKGSRVMMGETPALIAAEIVKGDQRLILRDAEGYPVWRGWRRAMPKSSDS